MKTLGNCYSTHLLVVTLAALGCGDDAATGGSGGAAGGAGEGGASAEGFLEASVSGSPTGRTELSVTMLPGAYAEYRDTPNGERISVHANVPGTSGDFMVGEQSLRIYLLPYDGLRTYTLGPADGAGAAYAEVDDTYVFYAQYGNTLGSGSITLATRTEDRLTGEFSFVAEDDGQTSSVTITGSFDLPLVPDDG